MTFCKRAVEALATSDPEAADDLMQSAGNLASLFRGTEQPPILVAFFDINVCDLSGETGDKDVRGTLSFLTDEDMIRQWGTQERVLDIFAQQANFRLANGRGIVKRVFEVRVENIDEPFPFAFTEICHFNPTE